MSGWKLTVQHEDGDGRKDIIVQMADTEAVVIKQEYYEKLGKAYEEMQSPLMMGAVLYSLGSMLLNIANAERKA